MTPALKSQPPRIEALDVLRCLAVLPVVLYHDSAVTRVIGIEGLTQFGWAGVDLFFVVSGFLITGILLDTRHQAVYYRNFYARRVLRIWPTYFLLLLTATAFSGMAELSALRTPEMFGAYLLFVQNLFFSGHFPLQYTWSVNVEEQFYLAWPFVVDKLSRRTLAIVSVLLIIACPLLRWVAVGNGVGWAAVYTATPFRLDGIGWGSVLALLCRSDRVDRPSLQRLARILIFLGIPSSALLLWTGRGPQGGFGQHSPWVYSSLAILFAGLVLRSVITTAEPMRGPFIATLQAIGQMSYGIYMFNNPILRVTSRLLEMKVYSLAGAGSFRSNGAFIDSIGPGARVCLGLVAVV